MSSMPVLVQHVEERHGEYFVRETRVTVQSVITAWKRGDTPETIREQFPSLSLADVYSVISYYLDHQPALDAHFAETGAQYERERAADQAARPDFYAEMRRRVGEVRAQRSESAPTTEADDTHESGQSGEPV